MVIQGPAVGDAGTRYIMLRVEITPRISCWPTMRSDTRIGADLAAAERSAIAVLVPVLVCVLYVRRTECPQCRRCFVLFRTSTI